MTSTATLTKEQIRELAAYLNDKVFPALPCGLPQLRDAVLFAALDLNVYWRFGKITQDFEKALTFACSIPVVEDTDCESFTAWMIPRCRAFEILVTHLNFK